MASSPILGQSYVARSVNAADARLINLFPEIVPGDGQTAAFLQRAPGLRLLTTVGTGPIRGLWQYAGDSYVVSGIELYRVTSDWTSYLIGNVSGNGPVGMADNGTQLFIACNPNGFIYNRVTNVLVPITDPDFQGAVLVGYLDGYFVYNQPNSQTFWVTALLDGTSVDPLDFASAEGSPDGLVSLIVDHREVWLFGTNSTEVWYNSADVDFPLQRIQGAYNEVGCDAAYSVAKLDNSIMWLGGDSRGRGIVYKANGYTAQRVSTHAIEWQIQQYGNLSNAFAYTYQQDGHAFYVLVFPDNDTTWVYDAASGAWHERAGFVDGEFTRHRGNCQMAFNNQIVIGDYENGNLYAYDLTKYTDNGLPNKWLRSWRALAQGQNDLKRTAQHSLQLNCEMGVGLDGIAQGTDPKVMLRWSDDGGHSWSNEHWTTMGKIGQYGIRAMWRRLGMTQKLRDRVYEVSGTDPVKIAIMGAELIASGTTA